MNRSTFSQIIVPLLILALFVVGIYGVLRLRDSESPAPTLEVSVEENAKVSGESIEITGTTTAQELVINNNKVSVADDGTYSYQLPLNPGQNTVTLSTTKNGKTTDVTRTVTREVTPAPAPVASDLSDSGPAENIGIIGFSGLLFAGFYYLKSRGRRRAQHSYKLFTRAEI